ncbi:hypothetical protein [Brevibacillus borstelensis]|uniref:hypothetical protein n=1 Tax=Brevibacillus borstelensis TaxID=45462 RepID=UPI0030C48333
MKRMFGVEIQAPTGKLPGFYAQVIHKIGDNVNVFDRDGQLLIVDSESDHKKLLELLTKASMLGEEFSLWHLPADTEIARLEDIGFESQSGHIYVYAERVSFFSLDSSAGDGRDQWAALEQMKETILGRIPSGPTDLYLADPAHDQLIDGIARAYNVSVIWQDEAV